ncbi:MAG: 3-isopropylmalate dehydratase small subunit [Oligosphaeraceae bacterium]
MKQKLEILRSRCVPLPLDNVDTDQIIPARYLKETTREESFFGKHLFQDWRYRPDGTPNPDFVLNNPRYSGQILLAGRNFGSGSSREHAAWAIAGYGFRAVVASSFADIHKQNELNNFVLPITVPQAFLDKLVALVQEHPETQVEIHLPHQTISVPDIPELQEHFDINAYKKHCFLQGLDDIDYLLTCKNLVEEWEAARN